MYQSLSVSGLLTLELHALNNEGAEGNTMMTRMVDIIAQDGKKHTVNAISGDMFKHILVEHLLGEAKSRGLSLCRGCIVFDANRICSPQEDLLKTKEWNEKTLDSAILGAVLRKCTIDDCAGILITGKVGKDRSIARKSCVEFGWVVGRPDAVTTDAYFHVKYVPEGRGKGAGEGENVGQNIFHRPASSGRYAAVLNLDLYRVGRNDITLACELDEGERRRRMAALVRSAVCTFVKPTGAHRNTQNPHVVDFQGVIAVSSSTLPAPAVSALNPDYCSETQQLAATLNGMAIEGGGVETHPFGSLSEYAACMAGLAREIEG